jgi:hypothetical protein
MRDLLEYYKMMFEIIGMFLILGLGVVAMYFCAIVLGEVVGVIVGIVLFVFVFVPLGMLYLNRVGK